MDNIPESVKSRFTIFESNEKIQQQYPELSIEDMAVIHAYSEKQYKSLNNYLRGKDYGKGHNEALQKIADMLHAALQKCRIKFMGTVYRGIDLPVDVIKEHYLAFNEKKPVLYKGFVSGSKTMGKQFTGNVQQTITGKTGVYIEPFTVFSTTEDEVLFNRNCSFVIESIYEWEDITYMQLMEV